MRRLEDVSEDEFIASFLGGEVDSPRFGDSLRALMRDAGWPLSLVTAPQLSDPVECLHRRDLLGRHRGFGRNEELFEGFPLVVAWSRWSLTRSDLRMVRYMDYSYWNELSDGSRLATRAAERIRRGESAYGVDNSGFTAMAAAVREGARLSELVLVRPDASSTLVVLEGHARLTAYALAGDDAPESVTALLGEAEGIRLWAGY